MLERAKALKARFEQSLLSWEPFLDRMLAKAWPSYALIALLQLKLIWNIWRYRDLTAGDTSHYFMSAARWSESFVTNFIWSPLYTAFYGTALSLTGDVYAGAILHRTIIVMAVTLGVLAVMRSLLPPAIALLIAAWWTILPINFDALYEVHLFALIPLLLAALVLAWNDTPWTRGSALAILATATVLVRPEFAIATGVFALICIVREAIKLRGQQPGETPAWRTRVSAYGVPLLLAGLACAFFLWRSAHPYADLLKLALARQQSNMCQAYAFSWLQAHPGSNLDPFHGCRPLMQSVFGSPWPTLTQMVWANPWAVWEYVLWNLSLLPNGLELALFNAFAGAIDPDFTPTSRGGRIYALILGIALLFFVLCAGVALARNWNYWWSHWLRHRRGLWLLLFALLCVMVPATLLIRPRPSYLFPSTLALLGIIGTAIQILTHRWQTAMKFIAVAIALIVFGAIPPRYTSHNSDRPIYTSYQRLLPFRSLLMDPQKTIVLGDYFGEIANYLRLARGRAEPLAYDALSSWDRRQSFEQFLRQIDVNLIYIQPRYLNQLKGEPQARELLERPETLGWRKLGPTNPQDQDWLLLQREASKPG